jgi:hypothetical protein
MTTWLRVWYLFSLAPCHMWPWATSLGKWTIVGVSNNGFGLTYFLLTIYFRLPCTPSPIPWFQLWPALIKLTSEQFLILQLGMIFDLAVSTRFPRSTTPIYFIFLPSYLCPRTILSLNDQVTCGPPNQRTKSILIFGLRESRFLKFSYS